MNIGSSVLPLYAKGASDVANVAAGVCDINTGPQDIPIDGSLAKTDGKMKDADARSFPMDVEGESTNAADNTDPSHFEIDHLTLVSASCAVSESAKSQSVVSSIDLLNNAPLDPFASNVVAFMRPDSQHSM
jgi:hypothetical protein